MILVGRDGKEKKRWAHLVQPTEIFEFIDAEEKEQSTDGEDTVSRTN